MKQTLAKICIVQNTLLPQGRHLKCDALRKLTYKLLVFYFHHIGLGWTDKESRGKIMGKNTCHKMRAIQSIIQAVILATRLTKMNSVIPVNWFFNVNFQCHKKMRNKKDVISVFIWRDGGFFIWWSIMLGKFLWYWYVVYNYMFQQLTYVNLFHIHIWSYIHLTYLADQDYDHRPWLIILENSGHIMCMGKKF